MLLQLENTNELNLKKLLDYARQLNLRLSLVDDTESSPSLPGKPLSPAKLKSMIEEGRKTGTITLADAHNSIRKTFKAD
ncbi:MAG: hypothetical protein JWO03_185 [Bacteroidetes bacterium]|nr:hypothetical protein [Bacteroidota bacterium]